MTGRRIRLLAAIAGGALWLLAPGEAGATGPAHVEIEMRYQREAGAEACLSEAELRAAVAARLGYDPFVTKEGLDLLVVRVRRNGARIEGTVERTDRLRHQRGKPTTIGSGQTDCSELGASLAVAISIAVDPLSLGREAPPPEPALAPLPPPPAAPPAEAPAPAPPRGADPPSVPTRLVLAVGPSVSTGALPGASFGVRAAAGVSHG
ncbi:MAG TPA: hypothetical protein VLT33_17575, partial [Labilithrix sp.]|nr:hypothetical protein [Labilithrix sp.]